jgi:SAM-dependent methyltransferase
MIRSLAFAAFSAIVSCSAFAQAQPQPQEFKPEVGQAGKDVVWVPTPEALVDRMLRMAKVTKNDYVIDLGSGDGRIAIAAAKNFGARATGIEYNPDMVVLSNRSAQAAGVADRVKFMKADIFESDFSQATVITMYLLPQLNLRLRPILLDLKPGTRLVSHAFNMDDWKPDEQLTIEHREAYLWIVPAKVAGKWKLSVPAGNGVQDTELMLTQKYQNFGGKALAGSRESEVLEGKLNGAQVSFGFVDGNGSKRMFNGRVNGVRMEGTTQTPSGTPLKWVATRA